MRSVVSFMGETSQSARARLGENGQPLALVDSRKRSPLGDQGARRHSGQLAAVAGEVSLVGVAGVEGDPAELVAGAGGGQRAAQAQHTSQPLGPVADRRRHPPAQRALADPELAGQPATPSARCPKRRTAALTSGRAARRRRRAAASQAASAPRVVFALERRSSRAPSSAQDGSIAEALVEHELGRRPSSAGAAPGRSRAPSMCVSSAPPARRTRSCWRRRSGCPAAAGPDHVDAAVREHADRGPPSPSRSHRHSSQGASAAGRGARGTARPHIEPRPTPASRLRTRPPASVS